MSPTTPTTPTTLRDGTKVVLVDHPNAPDQETILSLLDKGETCGYYWKLYDPTIKPLLKESMKKSFANTQYIPRLNKEDHIKRVQHFLSYHDTISTRKLSR